MLPIRIKLIIKGGLEKQEDLPPIIWGNCHFYSGADTTDYDWLVVYDEIPTNDIGTIVKQTETLPCSLEHTLLVTCEPPNIKLYSPAYIEQFGYVLSTHSPVDIHHPHHIQQGGGLLWFYDKSLEDILKQSPLTKTKNLSIICSINKSSHAQQEERFNMATYLSKHLSLDWYGRGKIPLHKKYEALDDYQYTVALENYSGPHHWTEKLADAFLAECLPFYGGHNSISQYFPEDSYILIPANNPQKAAEIIEQAITNNEYEKRLPAIREARRLILEKYNFWALTSAIIENAPPVTACHTKQARIKGRHILRHNPINLVREFFQRVRHAFSTCFMSCK